MLPRSWAFGAPLIALVAASLSLAGGVRDADCDGLRDAADAFIDPGAWACTTAAASPPQVDGPVRVRFVVVARSGSLEVPGEVRTAVDAAAAVLVDEFSRATRGLMPMTLAGPAEVLAPAAPPATLLDEGGPRLAATYFSTRAAGQGAQVLVVLGDDIPVAPATCRCVAWTDRARNPGPLGASFDRTAAFGAPADFLGVVALGGTGELGESDLVAYRFLHEAAHLWCCRLPRGEPTTAALLGAEGGHWNPRVPGADRDPIAWPVMPADPPQAWAYSDHTLLAMGVLDPARAPPARAPGGALLSGFDVIALSRLPPV